MEKFVKGDIVVIPFPFSNLKGQKKRPALVLADLESEDIILCQITSQNKDTKYSIQLSSKEFKSGSLPVLSYIRPNRIFTADKNIIIKKSGTISMEKFKEVISKLNEILN
ncbi:MAG: type II toxin-antitoxin system PemK/MazF family toxin [Bacteroidota bacterium]|nr:type II toxin-antitoxin system PemK/MazF family toxin [Bacteroidota bacterium]